MVLAILNADSFKKHINTFFHVSHESREGELDVELTKVEEFTQDPQLEAFSLIFRGPLDQQFIQENYNLNHNELGLLKMFLVPIGADAQGVYYQAIVNRLK